MKTYINCYKCKAKKSVWKGITYDASQHVHLNSDAVSVIITEWICTECGHWKAQLDYYRPEGEWIVVDRISV